MKELQTVLVKVPKGSYTENTSDIVHNEKGKECGKVLEVKPIQDDQFDLLVIEISDNIEGRNLYHKIMKSDGYSLGCSVKGDS